MEFAGFVHLLVLGAGYDMGKLGTGLPKLILFGYLFSMGHYVAFG